LSQSLNPTHQLNAALKAPVAFDHLSLHVLPFKLSFLLQEFSVLQLQLFQPLFNAFDLSLSSIPRVGRQLQKPCDELRVWQSKLHRWTCSFLALSISIIVSRLNKGRQGAREQGTALAQVTSLPFALRLFALLLGVFFILALNASFVSPFKQRGSVNVGMGIVFIVANLHTDGCQQGVARRTRARLATSMWSHLE
jgi:hypothetical protein